MNKIILKSMSKYPSNRYQESRSFARDLDIFLAQNGFEESNIELERYFSDREKFEDRLRQLDFTNRATVTVALKDIPKTPQEKAAEVARTKTHKTRVLTPDEQARLSMQQQNASAIEKPKTAAQITWMHTPNLPTAPEAPRRDHQIPQQFATPILTRKSSHSNTAQYQHTAMPGHFTHTVQHQLPVQRPGQLKKRRARPRVPRRNNTQPVVYRVSASSPGSDLIGLIAGVIIIGAILLAAVFGFVNLSKNGGFNLKKSISKQQQVQKPAKTSTPPKKVTPPTLEIIEIEKPEPIAKKQAANKTPIKKAERQERNERHKDSISAPSRTNTAMSIFPATQAEPPAPTPAPSAVNKATPAPPAAEEPKPIPTTGSFRISSQPAAEVFVDGNRKGTTVDRTASSGWIELKAGRYDLELRRSGYQNFKRSMVISAEQKLDLGSIRLSPSTTYELVLSATKQPVRVTITNLSDRSQRSFTLDQKARGQSLPAGRYRVRFEYNNSVIERNIALSGTETRRNLSVTFE
jgi:hypothetical protein